MRSSYSLIKPFNAMRISTLHAVLLWICLAFGPITGFALTVDISVGNPLCPGQTNGELIITVSGGEIPYEVQLDGIIVGLIDVEGGSLPLGNLGAGSYTITVTDNVGTVSDSPVTLAEPAPMDILVSNVVCYDAPNNQLGAIDIIVTGGSPPYEFLWNDPLMCITQNINELGPNQEYSVTVTDANNCTVVKEGITVAPLLTDYSNLGFSGNPIIIEVTDINGQVNPSFSDGILLAGVDTIFGHGNANFNFPIAQVETGEQTCVPILVYDFQDIISTTFSINFDHNVLQFTGSQAYGLPDLGAGNIGNPSLGNITLSWVTDDMVNGTSVPDSTVIVEFCFQMLGTTESIDLQADSPTCAGDPLVVSGNILTDIWTYTDPAGSDFTDSLLDYPISTLDNYGIYTLVLENDYGCTAADHVFVEIIDHILTVSDDFIQCAGQIDSLSVTPFYGNDFEFNWTPAIGLSDPNIPNPLVSVNATTNYYIEVFSPQTGCLSIDSVTVFYEDEPLPVINMVDPPVTCAGSDVFIPCPVSGPPGTTFTWFGPGNYSNTTCEILLENVNADNAGIYTLVVTNQAGCEVSGSFELVVEELANSIFTTPPLPCADESFTVNLNNTDPSYTYAWSPAALFNDPSVANPTATLTEDATIEVVIVDATTGCELTLSQFIDVDEDCLWPGDTDTSGVVNNFDLLNVGLGYGTSGPQRPDSITTWVGHGAPAWPQSTSAGVNYKHLDCDANGLIDIADTLIINAHWGLTHNLLTDPDQSQWVDDRDMAAPFFVLPDSLEPNATYSLPIILGNEDFPAEDVYGLAFSIIYDPEVIVSGSPNLNVDGSWLGDWGTDLFSIQKNFHAQGRLDLAMTRIDGQGQSGSGEIGRFNIIVEDIIFLGAGNQDRDGNLKTTFEIKDVLVINAEGEVIEVDLPPSEFEIVSSTRAVILPEIPVQITPNPTGGDVLISSPENQIQDIRIWNTLGHPVLSRLSIASTSEQLSLGHLPAGIYWVEVRTEDGIGRQRLVIE